MEWMAYGRRFLGRGLLAAGLLGSAGCLQFLNPVHPPPPEVVQPCQAMSSYARSHVYIFLANGVDPLCLGNLDGVRQYLQALGFPKTYYGHPYHRHWFEKELRQARKVDHDARFVLIGYGLGADTLRSVARAVCKDRIGIDLFISLRANPKGCLPGDANPDDKSAEAAGAFPLPEEQMLGSPTDPRTLQLLAAELLEVAGLVPGVPPAVLPGPGSPPEPGLEPGPEVAPPPRQLHPTALNDAVPDPEWRALQPVSELSSFKLPDPPVAFVSTPPKMTKEELDAELTDLLDIGLDDEVGEMTSVPRTWVTRKQGYKDPRKRPRTDSQKTR